MKIAVISDLHIDAGTNLGHDDPGVGNTRTADAMEILNEIVLDATDKHGAQALVFLGDIARTATPGPVAYRIAQDAFGMFKGPIYMLRGNHDYTPLASTALNVVAESCGATVYDNPGTFTTGPPLGNGFAFLPWTPPIKLFGVTPHAPKEMNRLAAEMLHNVIRGLAADLDNDVPKILFGHWLVAGSKLASGVEVMQAHEPLLLAEEIEAAGFDLAVFGHNHVPGQLSEKVWSCGPPMRGSFGEADIPVGYMIVDVDGKKVTAQHVEVKDRALITRDFTAEQLLDVNERGYNAAGVKLASVEESVVRLRYTCRPDQAEPCARGASMLSVAMLGEGASKVIVQPTVERVRRERERIAVDVDPMAALDRYLEVQGVEEPLAAAVRAEAAPIMGADEFVAALYDMDAMVAAADAEDDGGLDW